MRELDSDTIKTLLRQRLKPHRWQHCVNVAAVAQQLAQHYGEDRVLAEQAGLLHDYAKNLSGAELLQLAREHELLSDAVEEALPELLHAPVGAWLVEHELQFGNPALWSAIRLHTMGSCTMSTLDKIIFVADMIEPSRRYPERSALYAIAFKDLDQAMLQCLDSTIHFCLQRGQLLHPQTVLVRNHYLSAEALALF